MFVLLHFLHLASHFSRAGHVVPFFGLVLDVYRAVLAALCFACVSVVLVVVSFVMSSR